ncbi:MAG TPA: L,D-transpeptidase family protein [Ktedonobacteraceae bacterium]|nr:L,D-transpeptidase family protein [Ktedonobacteraceae bacterium]
MRKHLKKLFLLIPLAFFLAFLLTLSPVTASSSSASTVAANATWTGTVLSAANVRAAATTNSTRVATYAAGTKVTVYASVKGQVVWSGISTWYRISSSSARYIYSGLVTRASTSTSGGTTPTTSAKGKVIIVKRSQQKLYAYSNGKLVFTTLVTTGQPALYTPLGTYHVLRKATNIWFYSPWPKGSPFYYEPSHINYALQFSWSGMYLHDSWWRTVYGPGTNVPHNDPKYGWQTGTHGCVTMPLNSVKWLYSWAPVGTTIQIVN